VNRIIDFLVLLYIYMIKVEIILKQS